MVSSTHSVMTLIPFQSLRKRMPSTKVIWTKRRRSWWWWRKCRELRIVSNGCCLQQRSPFLTSNGFFHFDAMMGCLTFITWKIPQAANGCRPLAWTCLDLRSSELLYNSHIEWFCGEKSMHFQAQQNNLSADALYEKLRKGNKIFGSWDPVLHGGWVCF